MIEKLITIVLISLFSLQLGGQVFFEKEIYHNIKSIKTKLYNNQHEKGWWTLKTIDSLGRISNTKTYKKKKLIGESDFFYDDKNNRLMEVELYNFTKPNKIDTCFIKKYQYSNNRIIRQTTYILDKDSTVVKLDSIWKNYIFFYTETIYREANKKEPFVIKHQIIKNRKGQNVHWTRHYISYESKYILQFEYYPNGNRKRIITTRIPELKIKPVYSCGPGGDDQLWEYKYDKKNRIKEIYTIVEGKRYKLEKRKYFE